MTMHWLRAGRSPRGAPAPRRGPGPGPLLLAALAALALAQSGCQSGLGSGCNSCGGGCGPCSRLRERLMRPFNRGASSGAVVVPSTPSVVEGAPAVVAPSVTTPSVSAPIAPLTPSAPPSTIVPPAGGTESAPSQLSPAPAEPAPSAVPGPAPSGESTGAKSPTGKANYEAYRPKARANRARAETLARTEIPILEPAPRSAQGSAPSKPAEPVDFDNLPPIELNKDVPFNDATPPAAPPAERDAGAGPAAAAPEPQAEAAPPAASGPPPTPVVVTPGLRRFASFEPKLAGGSIPTRDGLDWLAETGYKTILDLREPGEVQPSFIAEVSDRGLRYVALPVTLKTLDAERVSRFNAELSLSDARPLYFCDTDGTRAGILWYVRRMTKDKVDPQVASREAEQIGRIDKPFWRAAAAYLDSLKPAPTEERPKAEPGPPAADPGSKPSAPSARPSAAAAPAPGPLVAESAPATSEIEPAADAAPSGRSGDPMAWRSYAALVISGLGVPLAYWSRASLPSFRGRRWASLAAPARRSKALPSSSDA